MDYDRPTDQSDRPQTLPPPGPQPSFTPVPLEPPHEPLPGPVKRKNKHLLVILVIVWFLSWPLAIGISIFGRYVQTQNQTVTQQTNISGGLERNDDGLRNGASTLAPEQKVDKGRAVINIISLLFGLYGVLGWIPVVIVAVRGSKKT